jgi:hypothetical protein
MGTAEGALKVAANRAGLGINEYIDRLNKGLKYCRGCQDWHPRAAFSKNAGRRDGFAAACRESMNAAARKPPSLNPRPLPERQWRSAVGYEGLYDISDKGDVWSLPRCGRPGRLLKQTRNRGGYLVVDLYRDGEQRTFKVHGLVMAAFVGPRPAGQEVRHLDGDPTNNSWPHNLTYGTFAENLADKFRHETTTRGERHPNHKLTSAEIMEIHRRWHGGESKRSLSRHFGVAPPRIRRILSGSAWQDEYREFPRDTEAVPA